MKRLGSTAAAALGATLALSPAPARATPVSFSFEGAVTGASAFNPTVLTAFPVGTPASFDLTFDAGPLTPTTPVPVTDLGPATGQFALGSGVWQIDHGRIFAYQYQFTGQVDWYLLQFTGTGPNIAGGGEFFGLFLQLTPALQLVSGPAAIQAGFGYPIVSGTAYSYAYLEGELNQTDQVPEPGSVTLLGLGLLALALARSVSR